jgi:hypothetical protein
VGTAAVCAGGCEIIACRSDSISLPTVEIRTLVSCVCSRSTRTVSPMLLIASAWSAIALREAAD